MDTVSRHSFVKTVLPALGEARHGELAMKSLAYGRFFAEKVVRFAEAGRVEYYKAVALRG